jgi:hypothetical protein
MSTMNAADPSSSRVAPRAASLVARTVSSSFAMLPIGLAERNEANAGRHQIGNMRLQKCSQHQTKWKTLAGRSRGEHNGQAGCQMALAHLL